MNDKKLVSLAEGDWTVGEGGVTYQNIGVAAALKAANALQSIEHSINKFPGCELVRLTRKMADHGIVVTHRHQFVLKLDIAWPWKKKRRKS